MAGELFIEKAKPGLETDVYAFGGLILTVMSGNPPYFKLGKWIIVAQAINYNPPKQEDHPNLPPSDSLWILIHRCWSKTPSARPTMQEVLEELDEYIEISRFTQLAGDLQVPDDPVLSGDYVDIYHGVWTSPDGKQVEVAIKELRLLIPKGRQSNPEALQRMDVRMKRKVLAWSQIVHPNLHPLLGYRSEPRPRLISPWCRHGNLTDYLLENPGLSKLEKLRLIYQTGLALFHLHSQVPPICHADIKPENVLINECCEASLSDFGLSQVLEEFDESSGLPTTGTAKGSPNYMAGELFIEKAKPGLETDVYAFGGLILTVMSGNPPYFKLGKWIIVAQAINYNPPKQEDHPNLPPSDPLWILIHRCWSKTPSARPTMREVLEELDGCVKINQTPQDDTGIKISIVQPGASPYHLPGPLPGTLTLELKTKFGSYSDVYRGTWICNGEEKVVCIKCLRNTVPESDTSCPELSRAERFERRIRRETLIWVQSNHANVVPFLGYQMADGEPRLVSPWMENGSLNKYLKAHPKLPDVDKLVLLQQAAQGLAYLHGSVPPIAHGDLKPENILIKDDLGAALCDMGVSRVILYGPTGLATSGSAPGSAGFLAKELIMGESLPTTQSDIYAMGGVILEALSGKKPFYKARTHAMVILAITTEQMCKPGDHPELPGDDPLWPFLRRCWSPNPEERPTIAEVIEELGRAIDQRRPTT